MRAIFFCSISLGYGLFVVFVHLSVRLLGYMFSHLLVSTFPLDSQTRLPPQPLLIPLQPGLLFVATCFGFDFDFTSILWSGQFIKEGRFRSTACFFGPHSHTQNWGSGQHLDRLSRYKVSAVRCTKSTTGLAWLFGKVALLFNLE